MACYGLAGLKRSLLTRLHRGDEALEAAWADYLKHPNTHSYSELMKFVQKGDKAAWHEKAIQAAMSAGLRDLVELLVETKETERLVELLRRTEDEALEDLSHFVSEPAAKKLEKTHPDVAARLWSAQGMRILESKKSKYYDAALRNFRSAKLCYEKAGNADDWRRVVNEVRAAHSRKSGFMPGFEELASGARPEPAPTFLQRAKDRWGRGRI